MRICIFRSPLCANWAPHIWHIYGFPQCESECASSGHHCVQTWHRTCHIYKSFFSVSYSLQVITPCKLGTSRITFIRFSHCECKYAYSSHQSVQTGHNTYRIYKVSLQCECEYVSSGHHSVQTGHHTYGIYNYKVFPRVSPNMYLQVTTLCKLGETHITFIRFSPV